MRVLFCPCPDRRWLYSVVPLAWACRAAGHQVRVAAAPTLSDAIVHTGLPVVVVESGVDDAIAFARDWGPDLVVHDQSGSGGAAVASALGVRNVRHLTGFGPPPMDTGPDGPPTITVDPAPPSLRVPVRTPWREVRYVPYHGPGALTAWRARFTGRPRICVTAGRSVCRLTLDALGGVDAEVILATTDEAVRRLGKLPGNVTPVTALPLQLLLPYCALVVHPGDDATSLTAAAFGVAQLIVTRGPDSAYVGDRLAAAGAGIHLRYHEFADEPGARAVIRRATRTLLAGPAYQAAALRLRAEIMAQPAPAALVPALETLALRRSPATVA
ncbi:MAG TPA: nucleotide disphospho-sugar-binding domain-containing protein [Actinophytocola sp.]|uniref:nucleotide disphospho-sugar-binding domain-containing protein n=1 Tax=Actinophytocola sp. TaxID=1872138 RepID=UPI002DBE5B63|nr:nucleotide disphospho-sugar-binding domain-containing protein [Actinophytocola sp.]HEU5475943.1 nucleotide disphospho-sugar-binding domain-containing protein [Actinophytocola sp.]